MAYISVPRQMVQVALAAEKTIINGMQSAPVAMKANRPGELPDEFDIGLTYKNGTEATDHKFFWHYSHDLRKHFSEIQLQHLNRFAAELEALDRLQKRLEEASRGVIDCLDKVPGLFESGLPDNILASYRRSRPYATTTLRGLWYPAGGAQDGAKRHADRNFLTIHLGDIGGQLLGSVDQDAQQDKLVSPKPGQALVFFGVKAWLLSKRKLPFMWHQSTVEPGHDRQALVHFVQADVGFPVTRSSDILDHYSFD